MSDPETPQPPVESGPPSDIAGIDAVANEPTGDESGDERPFVMVRGRRFHVRSQVPALILQKHTKARVDYPRLAAGTLLTDLTDSQRRKYDTLKAVTYEVLMALIVEDERDDFEEFVTYDDPPIDDEQLGVILQDAVSAAAGRPTEPS